MKDPSWCNGDDDQRLRRNRDLAAVLLIAPTAYHRLTFRKQQKAHLVLIANRAAIVGLGFLALAMTGVVLLVTDFLFSTPVTVACTAFAGLMFATFWYALPLHRRVSLEDEERRLRSED